MRSRGIRWLNGLASVCRIAFTLMASMAWGAPSVLLENRTADCPILFGDDLALPGECFAVIDWRWAGSQWGSVVVATNGSRVIPLNQPGFFDAGVGLLTPAPDFVEGETYLCFFEMRVWCGNPNYEYSGWGEGPIAWMQPITYSTNGVLSPLRIDRFYIWINPCVDCQYGQYIYSEVLGKGKIVIYPEGTASYQHPWPPWGPVSLHAVPESGYRFANWRGRYCDPNYFSAIGALSHIEVFSTNEWFDFPFGQGTAVFVAKFVPGWHLETAVPYGGSIAQTPEGTDFDPGTEVTLTARPRPNFAFSHWSGDAQGTNPTVTLKLDTNRTAVAHFTPTAAPQLIVQSRDAGDGVSTNGFRLTLLGIPGQTYRVDYSPNLSQWFTSTQLTATNSVNPILDTAPLSEPRRFYRARLVTP